MDEKFVLDKWEKIKAAALQEIEQPPDVIERIKEYVYSDTNTLILSGANGTGKSYAALRIMWAVTKPIDTNIHDDNSAFVSVSELNMQWLQSIQNQESMDLFVHLRNLDTLVLDDLGTRKPSDAFADFIYAVVNYRYDRRRRTIVTTNCTAQTLRESLGDAIFSRIASGITIRFDGQDRRFTKTLKTK